MALCASLGLRGGLAAHVKRPGTRVRKRAAHESARRARGLPRTMRRLAETEPEVAQPGDACAGLTIVLAIWLAALLAGILWSQL